MEGGNIQLPFGYIWDENEGGEIQFTPPFNFKKDILFEKLPYVYHLQNPALGNVLKSGKADDIDLQKYLLATGLMQDAIQENLNMVVTDGDFNTASIRRELDTKYPSVMKKSNPIDDLFKDKVVFDVQNPIVSSLILQVQKNKANERVYLEQLNQLPSITEINIARRLKELTNFNEGRINDDDDDDDDEDGPPAIPTRPPGPTSSLGSRPSGIFTNPPHNLADDNDDDNNDMNLNPTQRFLLQRPRAGGERQLKPSVKNSLEQHCSGLPFLVTLPESFLRHKK